jgi:hypothetical protein
VASLTVSSAAAGTGIATLGGHALQPAAIAVAPPSNDFGPVVTGGVSATAVFTARNTGELVPIPKRDFSSKISAGRRSFARLPRRRRGATWHNLAEKSSRGHAATAAPTWGAAP